MFNWTQKKTNKKQLRLELKKARDSVTDKTRLLAQEKVIEHINTLQCYKDAKKISIYLSTASEIATNKLINVAQLAKKSIYCPAIDDTENGLMSLREWSKNTPVNKFGIQEPCSKSTIIDPKELDIIFIPLLGFDLNGERLGMGGGYYDRLLEFKKTSLANKEPWLIGLAFDAQCTNSIPVESWDISLDAVITESKAHIFNPAIRYYD